MAEKRFEYNGNSLGGNSTFDPRNRTQVQLGICEALGDFMYDVMNQMDITKFCLPEGSWCTELVDLGVTMPWAVGTPPPDGSSCSALPDVKYRCAPFETVTDTDYGRDCDLSAWFCPEAGLWLDFCWWGWTIIGVGGLLVCCCCTCLVILLLPGSPISPK